MTGQLESEVRTSYSMEFKISFFIFFALLLCIVSSQSNEFFSKKYKSTYIFVNDDQPLYGAIDYCLTEGYILFTPMSNEEAKGVFNIIPKDIDEIWVGITAYLGFYYNLEGEHVRNFNWADETKSTRKVRIKLYRNGTYDDVNIGKLPFVCRKRDKENLPISAGDIKALKDKLTLRGYVYWKKYNAMYKYYPIESVNIANIKCLSHGASLFIPHSEDEINDVFKIVRREDGDKIWVGASSVSHQGFITYAGEVLKDEYQDWAPGQPESCDLCDFVSINRDRELETSTHKVKKPFVCKKEIPEMVERYNINDYKFYPVFQYYFMDAFVFCNIFGNVLFYPKSQEDVEWVFSNMPNNINNIWIGVSSYQSNNYYTVEGEKFENLTWNGNSKTKRFVSVSSNGSYHEMDNHISLPFVCKKSEESNNDMNKNAFRMPFAKKGYVHWNEYNAMYKYQGIESGFGAALKCQLDKATLFTPDSLQEAMDVFGIVPLYENKIWVGARKSLNGTFNTLGGASLENNIPWDIGQPKNCELCNFVTINRNGKYETANWMFDTPFVCKKKLL